MTERIDRASRRIHAPASSVFAAFATEEAVEAWLPPEGMIGRITAFDFRERGGYKMRLTYTASDHTEGKTSEHTDEVQVRFITVLPNARIEQGVMFVSDKKAFAGEMRMTWLFDESENGTLVTVSCTNVPDGILPEDHEVGLTASLGNLAAFVEKGANG